MQIIFYIFINLFTLVTLSNFIRNKFYLMIKYAILECTFFKNL